MPVSSHARLVAVNQIFERFEVLKESIQPRKTYIPQITGALRSFKTDVVEPLHTLGYLIETPGAPWLSDMGPLDKRTFWFSLTSFSRDIARLDAIFDDIKTGRLLPNQL